jgi:hypothetical protein
MHSCAVRVRLRHANSLQWLHSHRVQHACKQGAIHGQQCFCIGTPVLAAWLWCWSCPTTHKINCAAHKHNACMHGPQHALGNLRSTTIVCLTSEPRTARARKSSSMTSGTGRLNGSGFVHLCAPSGKAARTAWTAAGSRLSVHSSDAIPAPCCPPHLHTAGVTCTQGSWIQAAQSKGHTRSSSHHAGCTPVIVTHGSKVACCSAHPAHSGMQDRRNPAETAMSVNVSVVRGHSCHAARATLCR